jgi:Spy/CpxP family protein refolding chaperone
MTMLDPRITVLAIAVSGAGALGVGAWTAYAHGGFRGHRDPALMHRFIDFALDEKLDAIGATEAQKQKVREIKDRLVKDGHPLRESHLAFRDDVLKLLEQDNLDPAQVKGLVRERTEAFTRFADEVADAVVELHGILTPEQRKQLLADAREHMSSHRH